MALTAQQIWLQYITSRNMSHVFVAFGDSYQGGAGGVSFADDIRTLTGDVVINIGVGGATITDELAQIQAVPNLYGRKFIWWDGSANSYGTVESYLAVVDQMIALVGIDNFAALCPLALGPPVGSTAAYLADMQAIYAGLVSRGVKTYDVQTYLVGLNDPSDSDSTTAGVVGPVSTQDGVHLISTIMTSVATKFKTDVIDASGW